MSMGTACPGPGQAGAWRDPLSTSVVWAWAWALGLRSGTEKPPSPIHRPPRGHILGAGGRIEAKEPSEHVLDGDMGHGLEKNEEKRAGWQGGRRRPHGANNLRARLEGGEGASRPSRGHGLSLRCRDCPRGRSRPLSLRCGDCPRGRSRPLSLPPSLSARRAAGGGPLHFAPPDADPLSRPRTFPSSWPCRPARSTCRR